MAAGAKTYPKNSIVNEPVVFVVHPWKLVVTEKELVVTPMPVPWLGMMVVCVLFTLFCGLITLPAFIWGEPDDQWWLVVLISLVVFFTCTLMSSLVYFSSRFTQAEGPPLMVDRVEQMVHVPKHNLSVPIHQVDHLEVRNDMPDDEGKFRSETSLSELTLLVRGEDEPTRYSLMVCTACDYYDTLAREIARVNVLPVKRIKGVPGSTLVYEKWLTPTSSEGQ
ncbi:hypothetical protein [Bremerella sp.]|uniref:hypothetical protein n=1 Tax=Bremerella sp. TaxID=2795602 RepID=UPI0039194C76